MTTITVARGTLTFTGPADLLERPADDEITRSIAARVWRSAFDRMHTEGQHRLGYIETRLQLEYLCSEPGIGGDMASYCYRNGVRMVANPRPRGRQLR